MCEVLTSQWVKVMDDLNLLGSNLCPAAERVFTQPLVY